MSKKVTAKDSITNRCQGGGSKKAGLVPTATGEMCSVPFAWRAALGGQAFPNGHGRGNGGGKKYVVISTSNQLCGGVGRFTRLRQSLGDGVNKKQIIAGAHNCKLSVPLDWPTNSGFRRGVKVGNTTLN